MLSKEKDQRSNKKERYERKVREMKDALNEKRTKLLDHEAQLKCAMNAMKDCNLDLNWIYSQLQVRDLHCDDDNS